MKRTESGFAFDLLACPAVSAAVRRRTLQDAAVVRAFLIRLELAPDPETQAPPQPDHTATIP
jgi:hypothetical protein